jgi:uncharacterized protein (DUF2236 family)
MTARDRLGRLLASPRRRLRDEINLTVHGGDLRLERYDRPAGDPGLFGADSMAWRVDGDVGAMLTGGFAALMLQSLHPLAMAGVVDHSRWREDPIDRLRRTAAFVATTCYGSTAAADRAINGVLRVHDRVHGVAPDGRPYSAHQADLLTWVHVAEMGSFLAAYQIYGRQPLNGAEQDTYFAETARIAERLGAPDVPRSRAELARYLRSVRRELRATPDAWQTVDYLRAYGESRRQRLAIKILMNAAVGLLPGWARAQLRIHRPAVVRRAWDRPLARALCGVMRWAVEPSAIITAATRRVTATPADATTPADSAGLGRPAS